MVPNHASAELYGPSTGAFSATGNMAVERIWFAATLLNNGTDQPERPQGDHVGSARSKWHDSLKTLWRSGCCDRDSRDRSRLVRRDRLQS